MAHLRKIRLKSGTAYEIIYRLNGSYQSRYFPVNTDPSYVRAQLKKIESDLLLHKAKIKNIAAPAPGRMQLYDFSEWFADHRRHEIAPSTLKRYLLALHNLMSIVGPSVLISAITTSHIEQFKRVRFQSGATRAGINKDLHHIKGAFKFARENNLIANEIKFDKYKNIRTSLPDVLTPEELKKLSEHIPAGQCRLAFEIIKYTGIRRTELVERCQRKDFNLQEGYLIVHGKNREDARIPLHSRLIDHLKTDHQFNALQPYDPVISISADWLSHAIEKAKKRAGIIKRGNTHLLRHTLGTYLLSQGMNIREVQEILRHKTLYMTQRYTQIIKDQLKDKLNAIEF